MPGFPCATPTFTHHVGNRQNPGVEVPWDIWVPDFCSWVVLDREIEGQKVLFVGRAPTHLRLIREK